MNIFKLSTFIINILNPYTFFTRLCSNYRIFGHGGSAVKNGLTIPVCEKQEALKFVIECGCKKEPPCPPKPTCPTPKPACPPPKPACPPPKPACPPPKPACPPPKPKCPPPKPKCPPPDPCKKKCTPSSKPKYCYSLYYMPNTSSQERIRPSQSNYSVIKRQSKPLIGRYTLDAKIKLGDPKTVDKNYVKSIIYKYEYLKTEVFEINSSKMKATTKLQQIRQYSSNSDGHCDCCSKKDHVCPKCQKKECDCCQQTDILCESIRDIPKEEMKEIDSYFKCYKAKEYYMYGPYSYYDIIKHLTKYNLPQPSAKDKSNL